MLIEDRNKMRASIEALGYLDNPILNAYRENRDSNSWRIARITEELCEYILYLEEKINV